MLTKKARFGLNFSFLLPLVLLIVGSLLLTACGGNTNPSPAVPTLPRVITPTAQPAPTTAAPVASYPAPPGGYKVNFNLNLKSAGASFPYPVYQVWVKDFNVANPTVKIAYESTGSGAGRKSFFDNEIDFAGTDAYPTEVERNKYGKEIVAIPTMLGAVVMIYNLPGVNELKLSPEILGAIYTGKITKWNDPRLANENAGVTLPNLAITLAVRQDDSGTTNAFTNWLSDANADFRGLSIVGGLPAWEKGGITVAKGERSEGVAGIVRQNVGALGYVESSYAVSTNTPYASLKNPAGQYVKATQSAVNAAVGNAVPDDLQLKATNNPDPKAYPIVIPTWIIFPKEISNKDRADGIVRFVWWATSDAASLKTVQDLGFALLPAPVVTKAQTILRGVTSGGQPVLK